MVDPNVEVLAPKVNEQEVFVGPRPFERSEQNLFFGRDREISELLSLVTSNRVVLCYAPSGAGKTSLINAGLHPRLEKEGFEVLPPTRVRGLLPEGVDQTSITNIYIFNAVLSLAKETGSPAELAQSTLAAYLATVPHLTDEEDFPSPRILIFDQFEELLTSYLERWQERDGFFHQVHAALQDDPLLRVLFVMREDFVARIEPFMRILKPLQQTRFRLDLLGPGGAQSAVTGPLRGTARHFKAGVVDTLIEELLKVRVESTDGKATEVIGEYVEPVQLQVVCRNLWTSLPDDVQEISHEHLKAYGDVDQALREFYESCLTDARTGLHTNEANLRQWFERQLITPAGTRGIVFRDAQQTAGLTNQVVDFLENRHIIRGEWRAGSRWYELTHDRLIEPIQRANRRWRAQRQANRNRMLGFSGIAVALALLLLATVLSFRRGTAYAVPTDSTVVAAITSAYENATSVVVAETAASVAQEQVAAANENLAISQSRQLAAQALLTNDTQLARLLAVQANLFSDTPESRRALHRILSRQSVLDGTFLKELDPEILSLTFANRLENLDKKWVISVAFSPDGRRFVSGGQDGTMIVWDLGTAREFLSPLEGHRSNIQQVTFSPDGKMIASVALDEQVLLWNASSGERIGDALLGHEGIITAVAFSPDGTKLATGGGDGTIRIWDLDSREAQVLLQPAEVWDLAWSPDGKTLAAASAGNWVHLFETDTFKNYRVLKGAKGLVRTIDWSSDGQTLAGGAVITNQAGDPIGGDVLIWDVDTLSVSMRPLPENTQPVRSVAFAPNGKTLAIGRDDGLIALWDVRSTQLLGTPFKAHEHRIMSIDFSPDGRYMISGSIDGTIGLWNLLAPTHSAVVNASGDRLATSQGSVITLWDISQGKTDLLTLLAGHIDEVLSLAFTSDGNTLASSGKDNTLRLWDVNLGAPIGKPQSTRSNVLTLQFTPDGSLLALGGESGRVQLADPFTSRFNTLMEQDGPILKVQFADDGKTLHVVGQNGTLVTFDVTSSDAKIVEETAFPSAQGGIASAALSLDGKRAAYFHEGGSADVAILADDERAHGIILSYWDQSFDPSVNRDDIDFVIFKATEGNQYVDPTFEEYVRASRSIPMRGAFHFYRENLPWKEQADLFLSTVEGQDLHFYILDLEVRPEDGNTDFLADAEQWLEYVDEQVEGRVMLLTYTAYQEKLGAAGDWMKDWPLLILEYPTRPDRNGNPSLPQGFQDWHIWNYTENGNGAEYGVAADRIYLAVYNGTAAEMGQWLGLNAFTILDRTSNSIVNPTEAIEVTSPNGIAFSPDDVYLAAAGQYTVSLLNTATGDTVSSLSVNGEIISVTFTPDSNSLVVGTNYGTILLWDLSLLKSETASEPIRAIACSQVQANLSESEWTQYVGVDVPYQATCPNLPVP